MTALSKPLRILSLGAGVQSSTIALMAATGFIEPIDHAIFADTQDEPRSVYTWLSWLEDEIALSKYSFPVHRVTVGKLSDKVLSIHETADGRRFSRADIPVYTLSDSHRRGMVHRNCTRDFKIGPVHRLARSLAGIKRGQTTLAVIQLIGISHDEAHRAKPAMSRSKKPLQWMRSEWPLLELGYYRGNCIEWMIAHGYPMPPRSACVFCPYNSDASWMNMSVNEPDSFRRAVEFERELQAARTSSSGHSKTALFLHKSCVPLDQVDFMSASQAGQIDLFGNECEGVCGV